MRGLMDAYKRFLQNFHVLKFKKGEVILRQDEIPDTAYVVKQGIIKTYNITSEGEERPISFDIKGEIFPAAWVFSKARRSLFFYEALTDCQVWVVPRDEFKNFLKQDTDTLYELFEQFTSGHVSFQLRINALEQSKAAAKVRNTIHYLCLRFGKELDNNVVRIEVPLTQQTLANFMGLTRETTGLELKKLQKAGVLKPISHHFIVKTDKLNELLDEEYDPGFSEDFKQADV
jgi:CRP-like cAMP-binding protein